MKKIFSILFVFLFFSIPVFADIEFRFDGGVNFPSNPIYTVAPSLSAGFEFSPITIRERDSIYFSAMGNWSQISAKGIKPLNILDLDFSAGYNFRLNDRLSFSAEGLFGLWTVPEDKEQKLPSASGLTFGGKGFVYFHILPELTAGLYAGYKTNSYNPSPLRDGFEAGLTLKYNFSRGLFGSSKVSVPEDEEIYAGPLFPVFYARYSDHSFGTVTFVNNEKNDIRDVEVLVFIEQFMSNPDLSVKFDLIKRGEAFSADLTAFLNENILNILMAQKADCKVIVNYSSLGKRLSSEQVIELTALSRNSMTWEDDRAAAAFVSPHDASAVSFAKQVRSIVSNEFTSAKPENLQIGAALFGALKAYGINYVVDPSSAFIDNVGTSSIDFLKFPYQTLLYRGGDCDDLTILNCALFEALGIETAMITVPGHIFMAFDSGLTDKEVSRFPDEMYIIHEGKIWVPLEITLCQNTYLQERQTGYREWKKYTQERAIIPLKDAWKEFNPIGIPESDVKLDMPTKDEILRGFRNNK